MGRENDETHCFLRIGENALPVALLAGIKSLHQLRFRKKSKTNMTEANLVTSKHMREVKKQRVSAFERIHNNIYTVGLKKVVLPVTPKKIKAPTISSFVEAMHKVALTPISSVFRDKMVLGTKWVVRAADGRLKARHVSVGRKQGHDTDYYAIVASKGKIGRS